MSSYLLTGVGGQGVVLASRLIAQAALARGQSARTSETIGMAQRGGCVVSHVRVGEGQISPLIPPGCADALLGFEPGEALRMLPSLQPGGAVVTAARGIQAAGGYQPDSALAYLRAHVERLLVIDGASICAACGSPRVLNVALLGAAAAFGVFGPAQDEMRAAVEAGVPPRFVALNLRAFDLGAQQAIGQTEQQLGEVQAV